MQLQDLPDLLRCSRASAREFLLQKPHLVLLAPLAGGRIHSICRAGIGAARLRRPLTSHVVLSAETLRRANTFIDIFVYVWAENRWMAANPARGQETWRKTATSTYWAWMHRKCRNGWNRSIRLCARRARNPPSRCWTGSMTAHNRSVLQFPSPRIPRT